MLNLQVFKKRDEHITFVTVFLKFARRFFKLTEKELARVSHALSPGIFYV
jgi:hypothetical protein